MNVLLLLAFSFIAMFFIGRLLEKVHIPWIFSALLVGLLLPIYTPALQLSTNESFGFLADLGMYFMLFMAGYEIRLKHMLSQKQFAIKITAAIILCETALGSIFLHFAFGLSWPIALLVASSFATVGEAILLPILEHAKILRTNLGQLILSVGIIDDVVEIFAIIIAVVLLGKIGGHSQINIWSNLFILLILALVAMAFVKFPSIPKSFKTKQFPQVLLFAVFVLLLFVGIGSLAESAALGALIAGVTLAKFAPRQHINSIGKDMHTLCYGFFAPIFFLSVGLHTNLFYLFDSFLLVIAIVALAAIAKILPSYLLAKSRLGTKGSLILGTALVAKLSTGIVILQLLLRNGLIDDHVYSVLIAANLFFGIAVPFLLSILIKRWGRQLRGV